MKMSWIPILISSLALLAPLGAAAAGAPVELHVGAVELEWRPLAPDAALTLVVSGPELFYLRQELDPGETPRFGAFDESGAARPAGDYVWEVRAALPLDAQVRADLRALRGSEDEQVLAEALPRAPVSTYAMGRFAIVDGRIVAGGLEEPAGEGLAEARTKGIENVHAEVVLTNADGVIRNSLCVGFDCPNSPSFSDTTILMMENNTRIKFDDTSNTSSFPRNDWEIQANSSTNGGGNYLGFNDCGNASSQGGCAEDLVFAVEAGARTSALYVESDGDVGFGTANPTTTLHAVDGNTPTLRLEQDGSSGFTPQTWDVAGNESNFFVRDVTGGSTLPFRIQPSAPSNAIFVDSAGEVGFGTSAPAEELHVRNTDSPRLLIEDSVDNANDKPGVLLRSPAAASGGDWAFEVDNAGNFQIDFGPSTGPELIISDSTTSNGTVTVNGNLVVNGTCTGCDAVFQPSFELESIEEHAELMWANSYLPAVGPTPEGETSIDVFEKTTGILQELEKAHIYIEQLHDHIRRLDDQAQIKDGEIFDLRARLARLEEAILR